MADKVDPHFKRIALIGLGLIGGSLGYAIKRAGLADTIVGFASTEATRDRATALGFIDEATASVAEAVSDADLIVLCVPVGALAKVCAEMEPSLKAGAIVTDVGSVKNAVVRDAGPYIPDGVHFIPGHPIAGTEQIGA